MEVITHFDNVALLKYHTYTYDIQSYYFDQSYLCLQNSELEHKAIE